MSNNLSTQLVSEMYGQVSGNPFLSLFTLSHPNFAEDIYLVNNAEDIISRGITFSAFPVNISLPPDNNESAREVQILFDNVSLELIDEFRSVTTPIQMKLEMVLASTPNIVQYSLEELKLKAIQYNKTNITANLVMDDFLSSGVTSERYTPSNFPGIF
jgi:hypothetical protein